MDYDFSRLSTRSFEQLIQALSFRVLGSGITIFGDGPDGGREATFEGAIPFPSCLMYVDNMHAYSTLTLLRCRGGREEVRREGHTHAF